MKLTKNELKFLQALQIELNNQQNDGNADPVFWVIAQYEWEPCHDSRAEDTHYYDGDETTLESFDELLEYLRADGSIGKRKKYEYFHELPDRIQEEWEEVPVERRHVIQKNTFFISKLEALKHIEKNSYHYNHSVHTYAMTAWRSPQFEKLIKLLKTADFSQELEDK